MGNILKTYKIAPVIYYQSHCRKILGIKSDGRRSNITLSFSSTTSIAATTIKQPLRWRRHVVRMPNSRLPKQTIILCPQ